MNTGKVLKQLISLLLLAAIAGCTQNNSAPDTAIIVDNAASAVGLEAYQVITDRTTEKTEHKDAIYLVFPTQPPPDKKFGIWFMQLHGTFANKPFLCLDAVWTQGKQSHSCIAESTIPGFQLKETVTVGRLPGNFCKSLRPKHNGKTTPDPGNPIMHPSECTGGAGNCTCYEIEHECRVNITDDWGDATCPNLATLFAGGVLEGAVDSDKGDAPPGRGAGSGGAK
jgi:hypothetical protein